MTAFKELYQIGDWKLEKHVPVIEAPGRAKKEEYIIVEVSVGKDIPHPNTTEHHIRWIEVYFLPKGEKCPYQISKLEFTAHGESTQGPNTSTVYTHPEAVIRFMTDKSGTILASSFCNIHGLWESSHEITVE